MKAGQRFGGFLLKAGQRFGGFLLKAGQRFGGFLLKAGQRLGGFLLKAGQRFGGCTLPLVEFMYLVFHTLSLLACQARVTVGDSDLSCCLHVTSFEC